MLASESSLARVKLAEQAFELSKASSAFRGSLPAGLTAPLADLVRSMNCYYSNLIEGRNTTTALSKEGIIFSAGPREDWQIAFPAKLAPRLMPGLFP
jgi:hypothetical protein